MMNGTTEQLSILQPLPRKEKLLGSTAAFTSPPMIEALRFKANWFRVAWRLVMVGLAPFRFGLGLAWDFLRRRDLEEAKAVRMRQGFERLGGIFVKLGQQLSIRVDVLPIRMCQELAAMLDDVPPFDTAYAIERLEESSGRKLDEMFESFDPVPIGSASIACVYQARLHGGERVAVKVRRPKVGSEYAADFKVLRVLNRVLELLTIVRPGYTKNFRIRLETALMEELDFRTEARYQELFRRRAKKSKRRKVTAPKIYHDLCDQDIIVMKYVRGLTLLEVITAVERKDQKILRIMAERNIKPKRVARRLLMVNHAGMITDLFFHADPHPANVIVQKNGKLVFIDFGSCGSFSYADKRNLRDLNYFQHRGDHMGMARATVAMVEPLPLVDVDGFTDKIAEFFRTSIYCMKSRHSKWWERTSAVQWYAFLKATLKFRVPLPEGVIHMIRATLLYDTMASRLDKNVNYYREYRRFARVAGKMAKHRMKKRICRTLERGPDPARYLALEQMMETGNRMFFKLQRLVDSPPLRFTFNLSQGIFALRQFGRFFYGLLLIGTVDFSLRLLLGWHSADSFELLILKSAEGVYASGWTGWKVWVVFGWLLFNVRMVMFRFSDCHRDSRYDNNSYP